LKYALVNALRPAGAEARISGGLYAALKRRSSMGLQAAKAIRKTNLAFGKDYGMALFPELIKKEILNLN
jgi:hypothetical protein